MTPIFAVQWWVQDKWVSVYISSFLPDAVETYRRLLDLTTEDALTRLVSFMVDGFDFIGTHCRDFKIITRGGH